MTPCKCPKTAPHSFGAPSPAPRRVNGRVLRSLQGKAPIRRDYPGSQTRKGEFFVVIGWGRRRCAKSNAISGRGYVVVGNVKAHCEAEYTRPRSCKAIRRH